MASFCVLYVIRSQLKTTSEPWPVTVLLKFINRLTVRTLQLYQIRPDFCPWSCSLINVSVVKVARDHQMGLFALLKALPKADWWRRVRHSTRSSSGVPQLSLAVAKQMLPQFVSRIWRQKILIMRDPVQILMRIGHCELALIWGQNEN